MTDTRMRFFGNLHPAVSMAYFVLVLGLTLACMHPVTVVLSFLGASWFSIRLRGWRAYGHTMRFVPGDTMEDARESARVLSALPVSMVKLHSLYIPKECALYKEYEAGNIQICSKQEYIERLAEFISLLRKDIVVERLFSRIPEKDSAFSNWGNSWWKLTDEWKALMEERQYVQGIRCDYLNGAALNRWEM